MQGLIAFSGISDLSGFHCIEKTVGFQWNVSTRLENFRLRPWRMELSQPYYEQFWLFGSVKNPIQEHNWQFFHVRPHRKDWNPFWGDQVFSFGEPWFCLKTFSNIICILEFSDNHESNAKKRKSVSWKSFTLRKRLEGDPDGRHHANK